MPVSNHDIAVLFERMAVFLELDGANAFRIRAYQNAGRIIEGLTRNLAEAVLQGEDVTRFAGIGKDLAGKIREIVASGTFQQLAELEARLPKILLEMISIPGLGPKRARRVWENLSIHSIPDLKAAAENGKIRTLPGFGAKLEEQIQKGIAFRESQYNRILWSEAEIIARSLCAYLENIPGVQKVEVAGSYRRKKETVGDLDILAVCSQAEAVNRAFRSYPGVSEILAQGGTKSSVILHGGMQIDLRVIAKESYGAALHYFTGSQSHNIAIRKMAQQRRIKINEYGVFKNQLHVAGKTEEEVFRQVGLPYIPPELREMTGEIEAAQAGRLPQLASREQLRGDLHCHTDETDGALSLPEIAAAAHELGYEYIGITDHSQHVSVAMGLDEKRLRQQLLAIDKTNAKLKNITLLKGIEVDILDNGRLDLPDSILKELDFTVCSIHSKFNLPEDQQTERILRAMDNPYFTILGHPTGRLLGSRPAYAVHMERIILKAAECGCFLELNAHPERLDLSDMHCRLAKEKNVLVAVSSDAHNRVGLENVRFGINQARRGWLEAKDILNTRPLKVLRRLLRR
ncbi:DNA polymerase/3'-5' exonuclease PolX [candidate division FCPU426 bacterium]|nr:DNA polymerase/3'-5' exonuclease PolX [candidate division FCPU426 bacterium]